MTAVATELVAVESGTHVLICSHERGDYCGRRATSILHVAYSPGFGGGHEQFARCSIHPASELRDMIRQSDPGAVFETTGVS